MWPFKKKRAPEPQVQAPPQVVPQAGETWLFVPCAESPWPAKCGHTVTILDAKDGWVRYDMGGLYNDERRLLSMFLPMYRKLS